MNPKFGDVLRWNGSSSHGRLIMVIGVNRGVNRRDSTLVTVDGIALTSHSDTRTVIGHIARGCGPVGRPSRDGWMWEHVDDRP